MSWPWDQVSLPSHFAVWLASPEAAFTRGRFVSALWDVEELKTKVARFAEDEEYCVVNLKT